MTKNLQKLRLVIVLVSSLFIYNFSFAAADLVVTQSSFTKNSIDRGDYFNATISVKNIGNVAAITSYAKIFFTTDVNNVEIGQVFLSQISVKSLQPNETTIINFIYPLPLIEPKTYYPIISLDDNNVIAENNEQNLYCIGSCNSLVVTNGYVPDRILPCPIIFIHGLTGDSEESWRIFASIYSSRYGLHEGGTLNFCLDVDNDATTSDYSTLYKNFTNVSSLKNGDFYFLNFNVTSTGELHPMHSLFTSGGLSNQSAIYKQGKALKEAIKTVLAQTGASEVMLVGHSMGGLAARQYIQDSTNWQTDGKHHIAKLVTIGTPNGGSNMSGASVGSLIGGIDEFSEAVRDMRHPSTRFNGIFLFGGNEADITASYNKDIDCNGRSNNITGLNFKSFPADIPASCIIGKNFKYVSLFGIELPCDSYTSDGVVCSHRADLNNYPNIYADRFIIDSDKSLYYKNNVAFHNNLHKRGENFSTIMQALDEPKTYEKAYDIPLNTGWFGNITKQADNDPFPEPDHSTDYDDYRFQLPTAGTLRIYTFNIPIPNFAVSIVDASYRVLKRIESNGASNIDQSFTMAAGTYFFEVEGIPESNSYWHPYGFALIYTPSVGPRAEFTSAIRQGCAPLNVSFTNLSSGATGYQWTFEGGTPNTSTASAPVVKYSTPGTYAVSLKATNTAGINTYTRTGFISVGKAPLSNFNVSIDTSSAQFINLSDVGVSADYSWNFGDNTTSTEISPTHKYARTGTFLVSLVARNEVCPELKATALGCYK